jgi:outer membrane biosynthesis protein TonB
MADPRTSTGMVVSAAAHAAVLLFAAVSFAAKPFEPPHTDAIFVETMPITDFSQMMAGTQDAKPKETPKPLVEKKAEPRPVENQKAPVSEKPEVVTASTSAAPPPAPEPPPRPEPREAAPAPPPPPKPEAAKPQPAKPEPAPKPVEAEALKPEKQPAKKEPRKLAATAPAPPRRPPPQKRVAEKPPQPQQEQSRFDADQIAALLDKRQPRRVAAAGDVLSPTPAVGTPRGSAPQLSQNEIDALRARIQQCWNPPAGQADAKELTVLVRIQFNPDGSLATAPQLLSRVAAGYQQVAAESALRAIRRCAPYSFMPAAKYEAWKDIEVNFDPRDLYRG